jgi:hypothetical protein
MDDARKASQLVDRENNTNNKQFTKLFAEESDSIRKRSELPSPKHGNWWEI